LPKVRTQCEFAPFEYGADMGLNVHAHVTPSDRVIVFVHGLSGEGYETWQDFPKYVFQAGLDVAVLNYCSGLKRVSFWRRSPSPRSDGGFTLDPPPRLLRGPDGA